MTSKTQELTAASRHGQDHSKGPEDVVVHSSGLADGSDSADEDAQDGVRQVEAIASTWSTRTIVVTYILIWVVYFVMLMQQATAAALNPYVTSAFQSHSLTPTVTILASVIGGCCNLTVAKILDIFGRPVGYAMSLLVATVGLIMMAATNSVEMYAAAQVFWTVGTNALLYTVNIFVSDTTSLHNRSLMTGLTASPNIITIWLGGPISEAFLSGPGWQWAFGTFCVMVPVLCLPLLAVIVLTLNKAKKQEITAAKPRVRTAWGSFVHYAREFDLVGLLLVTAGLAMFLLPFNLYAYQPQQWRSPLIICLLVFGFVLLIAFALWEAYLAPVKFIPVSLLLDRNMAGGCVLGAVLFMSYFCWASLFGSFLQVVNNLTITEASYVVQIYGLGGSLFSIATGLVIRYTGRYKPVTLYGGIPIYALFMGLMIHFRRADQDIGYIIMCQVFISMGAGVLMSTPQIAAMSSGKHQHIAVIVAIVSMFASIGGAIGGVVAGAIWQDVYLKKLMEYLPPAEQVNLVNIFSDLNTQLSYPVGSPARTAIQRAYGDAQAMLLTAGTAVWAIAFVAVLFWRNTDLRTLKQVKGNVI